MSYDITLQVDTGRRMVSIYQRNITFNVSEIYNKAFNTDNWLALVNNKPCAEVQRLLLNTVFVLNNNINHYKTLSNKQHWEEYDEGVKILNELTEQCVIHYKCTILIYS